MKGRVWGALMIMLLASGCGDSEAPSATKAAPTAVGDLADWPDVTTEDMDCVVSYPEDLDDRPFAFDGTIEAVHLTAYDEDAGARPARLEIRIHEVFRGDLDEFVVLQSWDFMLPQEDLAGTRVLAATGHSLDLMGCGFTRPYSKRDATFWRQTFADVPPEDCGTEVLDCDLGEPTPVAAGCNRASHEYAIYSNIDAGSFPFSVIGCNRTYLSLRIDLGDCPPEATEEERRQCSRKKTAYFEVRGDAWDLLTYESRTSCSRVQALEPAFPSRFCAG
jgi:hypothetical protein